MKIDTKDRTHAYWYDVEDSLDTHSRYYRCSNCMKTQYEGDGLFCCHCGAMMDRRYILVFNVDDFPVIRHIIPWDIGETLEFDKEAFKKWYYGFFKELKYDKFICCYNFKEAQKAFDDFEKNWNDIKYKQNIEKCCKTCNKSHWEIDGAGDDIDYFCEKGNSHKLILYPREKCCSSYELKYTMN